MASGFDPYIKMQPVSTILSSSPAYEEIMTRKGKEILSASCFGKAKWEKFIGDIGIEPPLPKNIINILTSPCPYWTGRQVRDTHILVLIPETINKIPLSLNTLEDFIKNSQERKYITKYKLYNKTVQKEIGEACNSSSYWILITKDVLPDSQNKTYSGQRMLMKYPYREVKALEIAISIMMFYICSGETLYSDNPNTYTRCQEKLANKCRVVVGSFSGLSGLTIGHSQYTFDDVRYDISEYGLAVLVDFKEV